MNPRNVPMLRRQSLVAAFCCALALPAAGDIVTFQDGKTIKGLTRDLPEAPDQVEITSAQGVLRIQRSRIQGIQKESPSAGWVHIGTDHRTAGRLPEAIVAFRKALDLDPANADAQSALDQTQADVSDLQKMNRQDALKKIDDLAAQARDQIRAGSFDKAEKLYQQANDLVPSESQKADLTKQISQMYLAWGHERLDKFDTITAEQKFNLAMEADKDNSAAVNELLKLWEGNPDKREQAAHIYETILERHPDNTELRKKLGDLYRQMGDTEDMVRHYLELYKSSDDWKGTSLEKSLVEGLDKLHRQYAREKNYDKAIKTYNVLASIDPTTDPTAVIYYEFLKRAAALKPDDAAGKLALAQYAEKYGLDQDAISRYKELLANPATHDQALAGYVRYAKKAFANAQELFQRGNYSLARTIADQVRKDYPQAVDVTESATQLIGQAEVKAANEQIKSDKEAQNLVKAGDEYYAQADSHFQNLFSNQRTTNPLLMSDREEAKRYYNLAIQCYTQALQMDPSLARNPASLVSVRLGESRTRLASLSQNILNDLGRMNPPYVGNTTPGSNF